jgi:hypothetical protein
MKCKRYFLTPFSYRRKLNTWFFFLLFLYWLKFRIPSLEVLTPSFWIWTSWNYLQNQKTHSESRQGLEQFGICFPVIHAAEGICGEYFTGRNTKLLLNFESNFRRMSIRRQQFGGLSFNYFFLHFYSSVESCAKVPDCCRRTFYIRDSFFYPDILPPDILPTDISFRIFFVRNLVDVYLFTCIYAWLILI